jgi:hypothetical protein
MVKMENDGDSIAKPTHALTRLDGLSDSQPQLILSVSSTGETTGKILSSSELGDPTLYEVLQWHIGICERCRIGQNQPPPRFGVADKRHCDEYYAIAEEFGEYETKYAWHGNP